MPDAPIGLFITRRRQPGSMAELDEIERMQLERIAAPHDPEKILAGEPLGEEDDSSLDIEVALVVDHDGTPRYRLWGGNYGWGFLMVADSLEVRRVHRATRWSTGAHAAPDLLGDGPGVAPRRSRLPSDLRVLLVERPVLERDRERGTRHRGE
ncbi:MAG: hypothetical protein IPF99_06770 [Deltaproteobacteria bacterium]|nr:hypothetical protein [Deltaproteobacteria bacterium]